jgi:hypothetical protein
MVAVGGGEDEEEADFEEDEFVLSNPAASFGFFIKVPSSKWK